MAKTHLLGILLALASTFVYSIMDVTVKYTLLTYTIDHTVFFFQSMLLILLFIVLLRLSNPNKQLFAAKHPIAILFRGFVTFFNFYLAFYVLRYLPLDIYYSIIFTSPLIASILAVFFLKEQLDIIKVISVMLGLSGVLIITDPFSIGFTMETWEPILVVIFLSFNISLSGIITRKYLSKENSINITLYVFLICSILGFALAAYTTSITETITIHPNIFLYNLITAISCIIGFYLFLKAYQLTPIQLVAPTEYALIIWGILFGYIIFATPTKLNTIIGCIVVIASNLLIIIYSGKRKE